MKSSAATPVTEEVLRTTAAIVGPHSAAASALKDADRRRQAGEVVEFFQVGHTIFVHGAPKAAQASA